MISTDQTLFSYSQVKFSPTLEHWVCILWRWIVVYQRIFKQKGAVCCVFSFSYLFKHVCRFSVSRDSHTELLGAVRVSSGFPITTLESWLSISVNDETSARVYSVKLMRLASMLKTYRTISFQNLFTATGVFEGFKRLNKHMTTQLFRTCFYSLIHTRYNNDKPSWLPMHIFTGHDQFINFRSVGC